MRAKWKWLAGLVACLSLFVAVGLWVRPLQQSRTEPGNSVRYSFSDRQVDATSPEARKVLAIATAFVNNVKLPLPTDNPVIEQELSSGNIRPRFCVRFRSGGTVYVDTSREIVTSYWYNEIDRLKRTSGVKQEKMLLKDESTARTYVLELAKKLGVPDQCQLSVLSFFPNGDPNSGPRETLPVLRVSLEPVPMGYPIERGPDHVSIEIGPVDGMVYQYVRGMSFPYSIESHEIKLSFEQAKAIAEPVVAQYGVGTSTQLHPERRDPNAPPPKPNGNARTRKNRAGVAPPSFLAFVCPNGTFGAPKYRETGGELAVLRLAWVLKYIHNDEIWIDAGDGRILGGQCIRGR